MTKFRVQRRTHEGLFEDCDGSFDPWIDSRQSFRSPKASLGLDILQGLPQCNKNRWALLPNLAERPSGRAPSICIGIFESRDQNRDGGVSPRANSTESRENLRAKLVHLLCHFEKCLHLRVRTRAHFR